MRVASSWLGEVSLVLASIRFFEEAIDSMEEYGVHQISAIVFGSPPPVAWAHVMVKLFQQHYPERLKLAVVYPVPAAFVSLVRKVMWFVDENTRSKVDMETDEQPLLCRFGYLSEHLPPEIRGGHQGVAQRWAPDRGKILGLAYSFLLPHGRQVQDLEEALYSQKPRSRPKVEPEWTDWLFACCKQGRPVVMEDFQDVILEEPSPKSEVPEEKRSWRLLPLLVLLLVVCLFSRQSSQDL